MPSEPVNFFRDPIDLEFFTDTDKYIIAWCRPCFAGDGQYPEGVNHELANELGEIFHKDVDNFVNMAKIQ